MSSSTVPGTNVAPISFPGISSGIDYNSIITKLTSLTLQQNVTLNSQIATLNNANAELIKINNLIASVQNALAALSNPTLFDTFSAISSNTTEGTATAIAGAQPQAGTYTILSATQATATSITNASSAGHSIYDGASNTVPLVNSYAAITPTNGTSATGQGTVTVDGVQVKYDVNSQSLQTILVNIQSAVQASADAGFTATLNPSGQVVFSSTDKPLTLGSTSDSGNLLQVFKLTTAQVNNTATSGSVASTSNIGGINQAAAFNSTNNAGYVTPVTSGTFTINGVSISLDSANDNTASIVARINASSAGVVANFDATTNKITLTASSTGPQGIVLGSSTDTSNFLSAAGLTTASGATTQVGTQASVQVQGPSGAISTVYSNSNQVTNAINGVQLNLNTFTGPYSITVGQDNSQLITALNTFVSSYNTAINEINAATQPPSVITPTAGSSTTTTSSAVGGGVLWNNSNIIDVKNQLTNIVSGFFGGNLKLDSAAYTNPTTEYNSLQSIGLQVTNSFTMLATSSTSGQNSTTNSSQAVTTQTMSGTDGTLQALNVTTFTTALQNNPSAVQAILQGASSLTNQLGSYLGQVTGLPTQLNSGLVGVLPTGATAIIQGFENTNTNTITALQTQVQQVTNNANMQANALRAEFVTTEGLMAEYQAMQQQVTAAFKGA